MEKKGLLIGITSKLNRIFSKRSLQKRNITAALQDGNRSWITILACICADGTEIDPNIIYKGKGALCNTWVDAVEARKHPVFLGHFTLWMDKQRPRLGLD
jgi:hypothetical protein